MSTKPRLLQTRAERFAENRKKLFAMPANGREPKPPTILSEEAMPSIIDEMRAVDEESKEKVNPTPIALPVNYKSVSNEPDKWDLASAEYDGVMSERLEEVVKTIGQYHLDPDGKVIERRVNIGWINGMRCILKQYKEAVVPPDEIGKEELEEFGEMVIKRFGNGNEGLNEWKCLASIKYLTELRNYLNEMIKAGFGGSGDRSGCLLYGKMIENCTQCAKETTTDFCNNECTICINHRAAMNGADKIVLKSIYVQRKKADMVAKHMPADPPLLRISTEALSSTETSTTSEPTTPIITRAILEPIGLNEQFNQKRNFKDKFLAVTYTVADTDMRSDRSNAQQLAQILVSNFAKLLTIKGLPALGYLYVIEYTMKMVPHLHGLIRFSMAKRKDKSISASAPAFQGKNKLGVEPRESKEKMLLQPPDVAGWIAYITKDGAKVVGDLDAITNGWEYVPAPAYWPWER